jgi:hypothetical protein
MIEICIHTLMGRVYLFFEGNHFPVHNYLSVCESPPFFKEGQGWFFHLQVVTGYIHSFSSKN